MDPDTDSDFYGDETSIAQLQQRAAFPNPSAWERTISKGSTNHVFSVLGHRTLQSLAPKSPSNHDPRPLHNPYAGRPNAWQLDETVDDFLARLPPSTTTVDSAGPWIRVANPYVPSRAASSSSTSGESGVRTDESEGPCADKADILRLMEEGQARLDIVSAANAETATDKSLSAAAKSRQRNQAAREASEDLRMLAHELHVRTGKWMLFCAPATVDESWRLVADATARGTLGIGAKVATGAGESRTIGGGGGGGSFSEARLICVYTADFTDREDVKRVAVALNSLGFAGSKRNRRTLYYKPDVFTYLGIASKNPWDIKPSIYNTNEMLG